MYRKSTYSTLYILCLRVGTINILQESLDLVLIAIVVQVIDPLFLDIYPSFIPMNIPSSHSITWVSVASGMLCWHYMLVQGWSIVVGMGGR